MKINNRMYKLKDYEFKSIDDLKKNFINKKQDIVDLSIGDPDLNVHPDILNQFISSTYTNGNNKYPPYDGILNLKKEVINFYKNNYNVNLNEEEVLILIGSKEGISKLIPAICDVGDYMLIPEPAYPVYLNNAYLWGVEPYIIPLKEENNYLPHLKNIPKNIFLKSKLFIINYPNNPTGAVANEDFYKEIINMCYNNNVVLCNDIAYGDIIENGQKKLSLLQFDYKRKCVEIGTLSKTYSMTGFRIGYIVGNSRVLKELLKVKSTMDSGQYIPIQEASIKALQLGKTYLNEINNIYDERRFEAKNILKKYNIEYFDSKGAFYIWCKTPKEYDTSEFCKELILKSNIIVTPGYAFGKLGYDYFRISLTQTKDIIRKGLENLKKVK